MGMIPENPDLRDLDEELLRPPPDAEAQEIPQPPAAATAKQEEPDDGSLLRPPPDARELAGSVAPAPPEPPVAPVPPMLAETSSVPGPEAARTDDASLLRPPPDAAEAPTPAPMELPTLREGAPLGMAELPPLPTRQETLLSQMELPPSPPVDEYENTLASLRDMEDWTRTPVGAADGLTSIQTPTGAGLVLDRKKLDDPGQLSELPPIPDTTKDYMLVWSSADQVVKWIETTGTCP